MRELEFLPDWYPRLRQRRRMVMLQVYMSLVLLAGLALWMLQFHRNITQDRLRLAELEGQLEDTQLVLQKVQELEKLEAQLKVQEQVIERIGLHVEVTRLINALEAAMSDDMSLLNLNMEVTEQPRSAPASLTALAAMGSGAAAAPPPMDRALRVKVQGVAPTDVELANFLYKLGHNPLFERVTMNYARELTQDGHLMREFEVSFSVNLNSQG